MNALERRILDLFAGRGLQAVLAERMAHLLDHVPWFTGLGDAGVTMPTADELLAICVAGNAPNPTARKWADELLALAPAVLLGSAAKNCADVPGDTDPSRLAAGSTPA